MEESNANALDRTLEIGERLRSLIRIILMVFIPIVVIAVAALYFLDRQLFGEVSSLILKAREALMVLAVSLLGAWIIDGQVVRLGRVSAQSVNEINKAMGQMQEASTNLTATTSNVQGLLKEFKGLTLPQSSSAGTASNRAPQTPTEVDFWDELSEGWRKAKQLIDSKIDEIEDGRRYAKYSRMTRYDYVPILEALVKDGYWGDGALLPFGEMKEAFNYYRPQKWIVPHGAWEKFRRDFNNFKAQTVR